jgi:hypothetical protein
MFKLDDDWETWMFLGMNAVGAKAATEPTERAAIERLNFMIACAFVYVKEELVGTGVDLGV